MMTLGLTGGVGMGKSTVATMLNLRAVDVVDTDDLARKVVQPGQPALEEVRSTFGSTVVNAAGELDREALAALFWPDEPDQVAKQNLRQALYQLRQLLREHAEPGLSGSDMRPGACAGRGVAAARG